MKSSGNENNSSRTQLLSLRTQENEDGTLFFPEIIFLSSPLVSIASSDLRDYLKCGIDVNGLIPRDVIAYIREKELYEDQKFIKNQLVIPKKQMNKNDKKHQVHRGKVNPNSIKEFSNFPN